MEKWTYLILLAGSILVPLIRSFEPKIYFRGKWPALFSGILFMMLIFIPWDIWFTHNNIWHFNHDYVLGVFLAGLPLEEWLFFIIIPYACVFIYAVLKYFLPGFQYPAAAKLLAGALAILFFLLAVSFSDKTYTFIVSLLTGLLLILQLLMKAHRSWLSHFFLSYMVSVVPFLIVNGILTAMPVVIYDNAENLSFRITTIPAEDFIYLMSMLLIVVMVYEYLPGIKLRRQNSKS